MGNGKMRFLRLLFISAILLVVVSSQDGDNSTEIVVEDYLASLSTSDLRQICLDRGFDIAQDGQKELTHKDYMEAARRCLTLEDEMNAILAENPELAAELEAEVARMKASKEELERERDEMLAEKAFLEEQLRQAGVDIMPNQTESSVSNKDILEHPQNMTLVEVLHVSFRLLFERVWQDVKLVWSVIGPILRPMGGALKLLWRYMSPLLGNFSKQAAVQFEHLKQKIGPSVNQTQATESAAS